MAGTRQSNSSYTGTSIGIYLYKDTFKIDRGQYSEQSSGFANDPDGAQGTSTGDTTNQGSVPVWVFPEVKETGTFSYRQSVILYGASGQDGFDSTHLVFLTPFLCNIETKDFLYTRYKQDSTATYVPNAPTIYSDVRVNSLIFDRANSTLNPTIVNHANNVNDYFVNDRAETLVGKTLYLVPPLTTSKYDKGFWKGKTRSAYTNKPNVFNYPDFTKELKDVPVMKAAVNTETNQIEVKDDVIVDKVFPLLANASVIAASYYPV